MNMAEPTHFRPAFPVQVAVAMSEASTVVADTFRSIATSNNSSISKTSRSERIDSELIAIFKDYGTPDWDGYGAKAVSLGSVQFARRFLLTLPASVPSPDIFPEVTGEIALEWRTGRSSIFVVSIADTGRMVFAGRFGNATSNGIEFFAGGIPSLLINLIDRATR